MFWPTYKEYLNSSRWQDLREYVLARDGYRCRVCNSRRRLQIHHRHYPRVIGSESVDDLTTLCDRCHTLFHWPKVVRRFTLRLLFICMAFAVSYVLLRRR